MVELYDRLLSGHEGVVCPKKQADVVSNYAYMPVRFLPEQLGYGRDAVLTALAEREIFARKYFYPLTNSFECYRGKFDPEETPVALHISKRVLTLPLYADLALEDVDRICGVIRGMKV